jgi:hypothetical protein
MSVPRPPPRNVLLLAVQISRDLIGGWVSREIHIAKSLFAEGNEEENKPSGSQSTKCSSLTTTTRRRLWVFCVHPYLWVLTVT